MIKMKIDDVEYITIEAAADVLDLSSGRVRQLIGSNRLPHKQVGERMKLIPLESVLAFSKEIRPIGRPSKTKS